MRAGRRRFLGAAGGAAVLAGCSNRRGPWRFFTDREMALAAALTDCLIPPDDMPGAAEAGVPIFLDRQLAGHYAKFQPTYRRGLAALDGAAQAAHGMGFAELSRDQQTALLKLVEKGEPPGGDWKQVDAKQFFATVLNHTMQGFYGDPRHGGNRNQVGYLMIGIPATNVRGRSQHDLRAAGGVTPAAGGRR